MVWNVRGAGSKKFPGIMKDLVKIHKIEILVILEPRISGNTALNVIKKLGFSKYHVVDANGFSGGLWMLWNELVSCIDIVAYSRQSITALVKMNHGDWLFTAVYAHPCPGIRRQLWSYLDGIASASNLPWMIAGDFNELVNNSEKCGGNPFSHRGGLVEWIDRNQLIDLGFIGAQFTWCRQNDNGVLTWERLDRGLSNIDWRHNFPEAFVRHLPRVKSDHCPLLISLQSSHLPCANVKPFRFQAMWLLHPTFRSFVAEKWADCTGNILQITKDLSIALVDWNKDVFGSLFRNKKVLLARIGGIQKALCRRYSPFLVDLEKDLASDYQALLDQEELFWLQKSRNTWLREGDRNTKFFHLSTIIRRRRNKLEGLTNAQGMWTNDKKDMENIIVDYFKTLFAVQTMRYSNADLPQLFPRLGTSELGNLNCDINPQVIKDCLFSIGSLKAPGPDGFPAKFYHDFWDLCQGTFIELIAGCFSSASIPDALNDTLITLVPKVASPSSVSQLRPISLCNTLYKVVSKIIVQKLRPLMQKIVSPAQASFIPGRQIVDNIIVAQEVLHKFRNSKGKKGFIAWKIDLSKAYDRLHWDFIYDVLWEIGIRVRWTLVFGSIPPMVISQ
ncbi:uncharacterized protein LOC110767533 [Prunus avium]|uniref:Uncharacterized protein LOC110767533 n=1 Tax=Prunus avium TaxID=42229 RepID=A0A6P5TIG5_PRUAV|nr:uncharacterized protein LOC110767533 [Prunus avium]